MRLMRDATWPWIVLPSIVGFAAAFLTRDLALGWFALVLFLAMLLTTLGLGLAQGKTRWQQRR
jgi:1,4-dihydroxy-2-naphthoate octaprenyltransferase